MEDDELKSYYSRIQSEFELSHHKKDTVTNWSLTIVLASLGAYFGFSIENQYEPIIKLVLPIGTLMIVSHFFVTSLLAYGYLTKWRFLREQIEKYWIDGKPPLSKIIKLIQTYDHNGNLNVNWKRRLRAQFISGFSVIIGIPIALFIYEIYNIQEYTILHYTVISSLVLFTIYIILSTVFYSKFRYVDEKTIQ